MAGMVLLLQAMAFWAAYNGWTGGADMKVFVGLLGLHRWNGLMALVASGIAGTGIWIYTGNRRAKFPAVTVVALTVAISFYISIL